MRNRTGMPRKLALAGLLLTLFSCNNQSLGSQNAPPPASSDLGQELIASLPQEFRQTAKNNEVLFLESLKTILSQDPYLWLLVDKSHRLPPGYEPSDLVPLDKEKSLVKNKSGMYLRAPALEALKSMQAQAKKAGITLDVSSAYRSYEYQKNLFKRNVERYGLEQASRESAVEGASQHQLGLALDFGSITDAFAKTRASAWLMEHASSHGFSLSYPMGQEAVTGYVWESWHYRYVGKDLSRFIDSFFAGSQQRALAWIHANKELIKVRTGA